jgi:hypothetical protein
MSDSDIYKYKNIVAREAKNWIDEHFDEYNDWDYLWDDMAMEVTGNDGSYKDTPSSLIHDIVWDADFFQYCTEACTDVGEVMSHGETVTDVWARYMILDYFLNDFLYTYWQEKIDNG